jgi:hypothetical protein
MSMKIEQPVNRSLKNSSNLEPKLTSVKTCNINSDNPIDQVKKEAYSNTYDKIFTKIDDETKSSEMDVLKRCNATLHLITNNDGLVSGIYSTFDMTDLNYPLMQMPNLKKMEQSNSTTIPKVLFFMHFGICEEQQKQGLAKDAYRQMLKNAKQAGYNYVLFRVYPSKASDALYYTKELEGCTTKITVKDLLTNGVTEATSNSFSPDQRPGVMVDLSKLEV